MGEMVRVASEQYAQFKATENKLWHDTYDEILAAYMEGFNILLAANSAQANAEIAKLLEDSEEIRQLSIVAEFAFMVIAAQIYNEEIEAGKEKTIFDHASSVDELIAIINQMKFWLWEIEFLDNKEAEQILKVFVFNEGISVPMLMNLILMTSIDKEGMVQKVRALFS